MNDDDHAMMNGPRIAQSLPEEYMKALIKATSNTPPLFRVEYRSEGLKFTRTETMDLFIWMIVNPTTGEVDCCNGRLYEEDRFSLGEGYEWRKFRLVPESESPKP